MGAGAAYVYERQGSAWTQTARLAPPGVTDAEAFGTSLGLDGDVLAVGAPNANFDNQLASGHLYVYRNIAGAWTLENEMDSSLPLFAGFLGVELNLDAGNLVSSSSDFSSGSPVGAGAGHLFRISTANQWTGGDALYSPVGVYEDGFGLESAVSGNTAVFGSWVEKVFVFDLDIGFRLTSTQKDSQLKSDDNNTLQVKGAAPLQNVWLAFSLVGFGSQAIPSLGVILDLMAPNPIGGSRVTDITGAASWILFLPPLAADRTAWWQAVQIGQTSNALGTLVK